MSWSSLRRTLAVTLVVGLLTLTSSDWLHAASPSSLSGRVLAPNGADPRQGVVVTLFDPATERAFRSAPTDTKGAFTIDAAPAGTYALAVEAPEGAFLAASNLHLAPGVNRPLSLALKPGKAGEEPPAPPAPAEPAAAAPPPHSGVPTWAKWVIAGGIVVGAAIVIDAITKNNNNEASSF